MQRRFGNLAVIGQVRGRSKAVAVDLRIAMNHRHRLESRSKQFHGPVDRIQLNLRQSAKLVISVEDVTEHFAQERGRIWTGVKRQVVWFYILAQPPQSVG